MKKLILILALLISTTVLVGQSFTYFQKSSVIPRGNFYSDKDSLVMTIKGDSLFFDGKKMTMEYVKVIPKLFSQKKYIAIALHDKHGKYYELDLDEQKNGSYLFRSTDFDITWTGLITKK